jgi:hypothetical protein
VPSSDLPTTVAAYSFAVTRTRYATTNEPSSSSAALDEPAQCCGPEPGAGAASAQLLVPGSGKSFTAATYLTNTSTLIYTST